jgi:inner membrane transporter RhtA
VLALAGVVLLGRGGLDRLDRVGVVLALVAGALWAAYIVLSSRTGRRFPKADGLALAMGWRRCSRCRSAWRAPVRHCPNRAVLGMAAAVAVMSSVLPYTLEMVALRTLRTSTLAVLMSLGPAIAACAGLIILGQAMTWSELLATALVVTASIGACGPASGSRPLRNYDLMWTYLLGVMQVTRR